MLAFDPCVSLQISQKKLKKFEKEYHMLREQQEQQEAPIERYEVAQPDTAVNVYGKFSQDYC